MRHCTICLILATAAVHTAWAQEEPAEYKGHGYAYFSIDSPRAASIAELLTLGGGGDAFIYKGLAAGADLGWAFPRGLIRSGVGLLTVNPSYHFVNRDRPARIVPFVTAGYGLLFRSRTRNLVNYGGGATYWFQSHLGVRFEIRDFVSPERGRSHTAFRFALAFR